MARCCWPSRNLGPTTAGQFQSSNYLGQPIQLPIKAGEVHAPDPNTRFRPPRWDTPATLRDRHPERCACTDRESRSAVRRIADNRPLSPASGYSVVRRDDFDYQMRRPVFGLNVRDRSSSLGKTRPNRFCKRPCRRPASAKPPSTPSAAWGKVRAGTGGLSHAIFGLRQIAPRAKYESTFLI